MPVGRRAARGVGHQDHGISGIQGQEAAGSSALQGVPGPRGPCTWGWCSAVPSPPHCCLHPSHPEPSLQWPLSVLNLEKPCSPSPRAQPAQPLAGCSWCCRAVLSPLSCSLARAVSARGAQSHQQHRKGELRSSRGSCEDTGPRRCHGTAGASAQGCTPLRHGNTSPELS